MFGFLALEAELVHVGSQNLCSASASAESFVAAGESVFVVSAAAAENLDGWIAAAAAAGRGMEKIFGLVPQQNHRHRRLANKSLYLMKRSSILLISM